MNERLNKTSICSIIFLDIIDYSKKPVSDQIAFKDHFNGIIRTAVRDVAPNDLIILDTGDGAAIALLGSPEDAIFVSLTIRDHIVALKNQENGERAMDVRIGLNLGPVRIVNDINGHANIIGDGINVAQRIMSFAAPNEILVSRSYYEITSRLTDELTQLFAYSGIRHDKHVREHEVYAIRSATGSESVATGSLAANVLPGNGGWHGVKSGVAKLPWRSILATAVPICAIAILIGYHQSQPATPQEPTVAELAENSNAMANTQPSTIPVAAVMPEAQAHETIVVQNTGQPVQESATTAVPSSSKPGEPDAQAESSKKSSASKLAQASPAKKAMAKTVKESAKPSATHHESIEKPHTESPIVTAQQESTPEAASDPTGKDTSAWAQFTQSVRQGTNVKQCSQAERMLNQCH